MTLTIDANAAVVTGGGGAICSEIAKGLSRENVSVAVWDISHQSASLVCSAIRDAGGTSMAVQCDTTDRDSVRRALRVTEEEYGTVDILVNGAGGSRKETTTAPSLPFFDLKTEDMASVLSLNYLSAVTCCQEVGRTLADAGRGVIVNITSVAGIRPLTRALTYSDGKAALNSFTRWLAVHMADTYSPNIRVNAIAPGFILTQQNRFLLVDEQTGSVTERGRQILARVPAGRYGTPEEIVGAALWLVSDSARFVTGAVVPVDGGFTASSGV